MKGWHAYVQENPKDLEDLRHTVSNKLIKMAGKPSRKITAGSVATDYFTVKDSVLKESGVPEGWGKTIWAYVDLANTIYDFTKKDKGISFRIYNWPVTCPLLKKADKYSQSELKSLLQSITVGFIKPKKGQQANDSDEEATVVPKTILYMEAFSTGTSSIKLTTSVSI